MTNPDTLRDALWQLSFQFKINIKRAIAAKGLQLNGMHLRLLHLLARRSPISANQLATITGRDKAQITRLIKELEAKQLLQRHANPADKRSQLLALSHLGSELTAQTQKVEKQVESRLLEGMTEADIATFCELANRMLANLRDD